MASRHHLMVRADVLSPPNDPEAAKDWLLRLIDAIGMKLAAIEANPIAYYCATPGNRGLTAAAIIETSNITLHTWDETDPGELQLDLFTCGDLDVKAALSFVEEFAPVTLDYLVIDRVSRLALRNP